jgi:predicted ATPase
MHYIGDSYPASFDAFAENMYSKIFILPLGEIYVSDEARYENYEQAKLIQNHLIETYEVWLFSYRVPKDTIDNRILLS